MKKILRFKWIFIIILIVFIFSAMNARVSHGMSQRVAFIIWYVFGRWDTQSYTIQQVETFVRKFAHFIEYFLLYSIIFVGARDYIKTEYNKYLLPILLIVCIAIIDESLIQSFIGTGRSGNVYDVIIDITGAMLSMFNIFMLSIVLKYGIDDKK